MTNWIKYEKGMKDPQTGDIVVIPKGTFMTHYCKRRYMKANSKVITRRAGVLHDVVVLRVIPGESILTTTGTATIKEVALADVLLDKDKA